jgi:hypothetical protein
MMFGSVKIPLKSGEKRERKGNKLMMKIFVGVLLLIAILAWVDPLKAGGYNTTTDVTNVTNVTNFSGLSNSDRDAIHAGLAAASAAGACHFDYSTAMQGCGSAWNFEGEWGVNFQVGKRIDTMLFTGGCNVGLIDGQTDELVGCGGSVNWHF